MNNRREYEIAFVGLKPGVHEFDYEVDDRFFEEYGAQDFKIAQAHVKLMLEKNNNFMILRFQVGGRAEVVCDRCVNELPLQLFEDFTLTVNRGFQNLRQCVHTGNAHTMQTAGNFIRILVELTAGVQHRHHHFQR